jgi:hypothetical protein
MKMICTLKNMWNEEKVKMCKQKKRKIEEKIGKIIGSKKISERA